MLWLLSVPIALLVDALLDEDQRAKMAAAWDEAGRHACPKCGGLDCGVHRYQAAGTCVVTDASWRQD